MKPRPPFFELLTILFTTLSISSCGRTIVKVVPERPIQERLDSVLTNLSQAESIYLDKMVPSGTKYLLLDKDELVSGMEWLGYSLIENIDGNGAYSFATNFFVKDGKEASLSIKLANEPPNFNWSFERDANLSAEVRQAFSGAVAFNDHSIYEFVISKVADFTVDKSVFDEKTFNATIFSLYLTSLKPSEKPNPSGYDLFKKSYGVAKGGSLYEVTVHEYKSTKIDGEADIMGLVKTKAGYFKKTNEGGRKTIFKLFYINPGHVQSELFAQAEKIKEGLKNVDKTEVSNAIRNADAKDASGAEKAGKTLTNSVRALLEKGEQ